MNKYNIIFNNFIGKLIFIIKSFLIKFRFNNEKDEFHKNRTSNFNLFPNSNLRLYIILFLFTNIFKVLL